LRQIKVTLRRHRHRPIAEQGRWLGQVVNGYFAYRAAPTNCRALNSFYREVVRSSATGCARCVAAASGTG
jgi:RNA-directed DNA polymerase